MAHFRTLAQPYAEACSLANLNTTPPVGDLPITSIYAYNTGEPHLHAAAHTPVVTTENLSGPAALLLAFELAWTRRITLSTELGHGVLAAFK